MFLKINIFYNFTELMIVFINFSAQKSNFIEFEKHFLVRFLVYIFLNVFDRKFLNEINKQCSIQIILIYVGI